MWHPQPPGCGDRQAPPWGCGHHVTAHGVRLRGRPAGIRPGGERGGQTRVAGSSLVRFCFEFDLSGKYNNRSSACFGLGDALTLLSYYAFAPEAPPPPKTQGPCRLPIRNRLSSQGPAWLQMNPMLPDRSPWLASGEFRRRHMHRFETTYNMNPNLTNLAKI